MQILPVNYRFNIKKVHTIQLSYSYSYLAGRYEPPFTCQCWGLPHRLVQCTTPGVGQVCV